MSFELREDDDGWRLRAGLEANGGEGFRPQPPPTTAIERVLAIHLHQGIRPGTVRFMALVDGEDGRRRVDLATVIQLLPAALGGTLILWAVNDARSSAQGVVAITVAVLMILLVMRGLSRRYMGTLHTAVLTDSHLLVVAGSGAQVRIRSEVPADAITHARIDSRSGPQKPVTITFHGPHGPVRSFKTANMSRTVAEFALHEARVPLGDPDRSWPDAGDGRASAQ